MQRNKRQGQEIEGGRDKQNKTRVLLNAKAGWEGEEAGGRVHPKGKEESRGSQEEEFRWGGGRREQSKAHAHIGKSTSLKTDKDLQTL